MSPLANRLLFALQSLSVGYQPHPCGGFTTDDMQWRLETAFTPEEDLAEAIEELSQLKFIRYAGFDAEDGIGHCYELINVTKGTDEDPRTSVTANGTVRID